MVSNLTTTSRMSPASSSSSSTATTTAQEQPSMHSNAQKPARQTDYVSKSRRQTSWNPLLFIERKLFGIYWHVESVFALSMLEAWEVFLVIVVFLTLTSLIMYSLIFYFPRHIQLVARRAMYYVYGTVPSSASSASGIAGLGVSAPKAAAAASEAASLLSSVSPPSSTAMVAAASKVDL